MQNAGMAALGLDWRYLAFDVPPEELRAALLGARAMGFIGLNLTVPHKVLALDMVDVLDESASTWGAVNTVRFEARGPEGTWKPLHEWAGGMPAAIRSHGFNTDAEGIARSLREDLKLELRGARVLLLGAGGAGRTAALKLATEGVSEIFLVNRTRSKAETIAKEILRQSPDVKVAIGYPEVEMDLLLNATSLGLNESDPLPVDGGQFPLHRARAVYDMVYRPAETPLLRAAQAAGCRIANGLGMLLHQGAKALELWSGRTAPVEEMREALKREIYRAI